MNTEINNLCDCQSCGRYLRNHVGSTDCCGALAAVIYDGKKILASADKYLKNQGWTRLKTPVSHCWYNPDHIRCEDGNVLYEDEELAEILYPPPPIMPTTPPQPAHGEPWPTIYLDESIGCFGDVRRQDTEEQYIHIQPVGPGGSKERNDQRQAIGQRVADTWNLLAPHPDLSAVEVHSKETMDEVRELLTGLLDWGTSQSVVISFKATCALAKLNPPQG